MKWTPVSVPPTVEALAHRFSLACKQAGYGYVSISATNGSLTGISIMEGDEFKSLYLIDGEWCEYAEVPDGQQ